MCHSLGIVLAAGGSTRLGQPKQLVTLRSETLVHAAVRAAQEAGCSPVYVVTGHMSAEVEDAVADLRPTLIHNAHWREGIGCSIRAGVHAMTAVSSVVLIACDQPAVDAEIIRMLIDQHEQTSRPIVASHYAGTLGIPALFAAACFAELLALPAKRGAKAVINADLSRMASIGFPAGAFDLDSKSDLDSWQMRTAED